jgi:hypothetical protein
MGHSTIRAALICQHMNSDRDQEIAGRMGEAVRRQLGLDDPPGSDPEPSQAD